MSVATTTADDRTELLYRRLKRLRTYCRTRMAVNMKTHQTTRYIDRRDKAMARVEVYSSMIALLDEILLGAE